MLKKLNGKLKQFGKSTFEEETCFYWTWKIKLFTKPIDLNVVLDIPMFTLPNLLTLWINTEHYYWKTKKTTYLVFYRYGNLIKKQTKRVKWQTRYFVKLIFPQKGRMVASYLGQSKITIWKTHQAPPDCNCIFQPHPSLFHKVHSFTHLCPLNFPVYLNIQ